MYKYLCLIPVLWLAACDSDTNSNLTPKVASNLEEAKAAVEHHYAEWRYFEQENYMFTLAHTNGIACSDTASGELPRLRVTVRDEEVHSIYNADEADVVYDPQGLGYVGTLAHIFEWVLSELDKDPQVVSYWYGNDVANELPKFDENFHFIEQIYIENITENNCLSTLLSIVDFN